MTPTQLILTVGGLCAAALFGFGWLMWWITGDDYRPTRAHGRPARALLERHGRHRLDDTEGPTTTVRAGHWRS